ncbi:MAG TPA: hypothetical protein EYP14_18170 [Planctomycetaceae bacterium]|nr:hypothetical protein [Planctomycetaceae bacterium]
MASPPSWLRDLADRVAGLMRAADILAPIGCHYCHAQFPKDQWEVTLFVAKTETVGGPQDGATTLSPFTLDLAQLMELFSEVESFHWQALRFGPGDELGPHISIEGHCGGVSVWLRVLAEPPDRFGPGRNICVDHGEIILQDVW